MSGDDLFERVGEALYGPHFTTPLAEALGVSERSVRYWRAGRPVPDGVWGDLCEVAAQRIAEINAAVKSFAGERED